MPLVNAAEHEYDAAHYVATSKVSEGTTKATCTATASTMEDNTLDVVCNAITDVELENVKAADAKGFKTEGRGYWLNVQVDLSGLHTDVSLEHAESTVNFNGQTIRLNNDKYVTKNKLDLWVKLDPNKIGTKEKSSPVVAILNFRDTKDNEGNGKTYSQKLNIRVDYTSSTSKNTPKTSGVYVLQIAKSLDGKIGKPETVYVPFTETAPKLNKVSELDKYLTETGYLFRGVKETTDFQTATTLVDLAATDLTDGKKYVVVFEKDSNYVAPADKPEETPGSSTTKPADKDKDSTPKTGNTDLMGFVPLMTLLSLVGIVTLKKTI